MLELWNITVGYGKKTVLRELSASFETGKLTGIIGVNGCGKSTLLSSILGFLPLRDGRILLDGTELSTVKRGQIAKRISYLPQGRSTPDMTVEQMVLHGRFPYRSYPKRYTDADRAIARNAMERVGILEYSAHPLGALSGGMRQTAYLAMALTQDTDYILLDEPTTYLDVAHQLDLMRLLRTLAERGKGIIAVMHDLPMAFTFCDELLVINGGRAEAQEKPDALCDSPAIPSLFGVRLTRTGENGSYYYDLTPTESASKLHTN